MPINVSTLTVTKKSKLVNSLLFLTKKHSGKVKGGMIYNSKPTWEWLSKEESASPAASLESIFLTAVIDAKENCDVMMADIPNAFIQVKHLILFFAITTKLDTSLSSFIVIWSFAL